MTNSAAHHRLSRRLVAPLAALALLGPVLSGCGEDSSGADPTGTGPTATVGASVTPSTTPVATPSATAKPRPSSKPKPTEGSGDDEGDDEPAAAGGGVCAELGEDEVGALLGGAVTGAAMPGGGCTFNQRRPDPPAATVTDLPYAEMVGGMDGAKTNATSSVEGEPEDLTGIGEQAFVVTGTSFGGTDVQGAGAVRVGDRVVVVNLAQSEGLKRAKVRALVVQLLRLVVSRIG